MPYLLRSIASLKKKNMYRLIAFWIFLTMTFALRYFFPVDVLRSKRSHIREIRPRSLRPTLDIKPYNGRGPQQHTCCFKMFQPKFRLHSSTNYYQPWWHCHPHQLHTRNARCKWTINGCSALWRASTLPRTSDVIREEKLGDLCSAV